MVDPVFVSDGHTYERSAIQQWLAKRLASPKTGAEMGGMLIPNHGLKALIQDWMAERSISYPQPQSVIDKPTVSSEGEINEVNTDVRLLCLRSQRAYDLSFRADDESSYYSMKVWLPAAQEEAEKETHCRSQG